MKKLMIAALAVASCTAFAEFVHPDVSAPLSGFYDVQITSKRLAHATKTVSKTFSTKNKGKPTEQSAVSQLIKYYNDENLVNRAGFEVINLNGLTYWDTEAKEVCEASKITFKYSYNDFKVVQTKDTVTGLYVSKTNYVTKVVTDNLKGVYDADTGKVYAWDSAAAAKVTVKYTDSDEAIIVSSKKDGKGNEKDQKGFKAYEVPLVMKKQFIATDDNKAAGGFVGKNATAKDGTPLEFEGMTAFGTGTFDAEKKNNKDQVTQVARVKTVSGNIAGKDELDPMYGCYGTWKINLDKTNSDKYKGDLKGLLVQKKGCVELVLERE